MSKYKLRLSPIYTVHAREDGHIELRLARPVTVRRIDVPMERIHHRGALVGWADRHGIHMGDSRVVPACATHLLAECLRYIDPTATDTKGHD